MKIKIAFIIFFIFSAGVFIQTAEAAEINNNIDSKQAKTQEKENKLKEKLLRKQKKESEKKLRQEQKSLEAQKKAQEEDAARQLEELVKKEKLRQKEERKKELQKLRDSLAGIVSLSVDYDMKFRGAFYSNTDYTSANKRSSDAYLQYLSLNIIGKFDGKIEMASKISSYGFSGKFYPSFAMPYERNDFSAFLETAFIKYKDNINYNTSYCVTVGKQAFSVGDGLIFDANNNGMLGARGALDFSNLFSIDLFAAKDNNKDFNIYGAALAIKTGALIEIGLYQEKNNTGYEYSKGIYVQDPAFKINYDNKTFYDFRITGGNQKYKYKIEAARQTGELVKSSFSAVEYDAYSFVFEGSWKGKILNKLNAGAALLFSYAGADNENAFNPTFTKRYDGAQRTGYGTLFAATASDSFLTLPRGYYGINTFAVKFEAFPMPSLQSGAGVFLYSASDAPANAYVSSIDEIYGAKGSLGNEIDFFIKYICGDYFDVTFDFALYTPPDDKRGIFANTEASYLFQIGISSKF
ncbi:MAG: trichohyalin-plectin-homology domain domain-containing protein [Endomicrobium sp.]|jgi:hypothetical protein|nr:trichohyalin-plectin-homology domain domain-containing protein [Endomicrobium sp.]